MKTDPTASVSGAAGMPLAYEAVESRRNLATNANLNAKPKDAISDTLETTDREGDGRQILELNSNAVPADTDDLDQQDRLDLTG